MINIITCVNQRSGAGHISRMENFRKYLKKNKFKCNLVLIKTFKKNKYLVHNNIDFKYKSEIKFNENSLNFIDLPDYYSSTYINKIIKGKNYYFDRPKLKNSINQKILKSKKRISLQNFFISTPPKKNKIKYDFLISGGGLIDRFKYYRNKFEKSSFSYHYIGPFLRKKNSNFLKKKIYLQYLSSSKCLITNYGVSVFEAMNAKIPILIINCKKKDIKNLKTLNLKYLKDISLDEFSIKSYKKEIFSKEIYIDNKETYKLILSHNLSYS